MIKLFFSNYSAIQQGGHTGPPLPMPCRIVGADLCVRPALPEIIDDVI
jgi:hypothetical protein